MKKIDRAILVASLGSTFVMLYAYFHLAFRFLPESVSAMVEDRTMEILQANVLYVCLIGAFTSAVNGCLLVDLWRTRNEKRLQV